MDLALQPNLYGPSIDANGNYVDRIPYGNTIMLQCPCGTRKDKVYETHSMFAAHTKTKTHQKWIHELNLNKANFFTENIELKSLIHNQRKIIASLEKDISDKTRTIDYLIAQLTTTSSVEEDLIDFL
jgi:hypothetical protein